MAKLTLILVLFDSPSNFLKCAQAPCAEAAALATDL